MTTAKNQKRPPSKGQTKAQAQKASAAPAKDSGKKTGSTPISKAGGRTTGPDKKAERKIPWLGIIFGVVALALVAAIVFSSDTSIGSEAGDPEITGEALAPFGDAAADPTQDPAVGTPAPVVVGEDFNGDAVTIGGTGQPTAVVFLAHWCPHCQAEVPRVQQWLDAGGGVEGVELVSVATSMSSARENYPASDWLERENWTSPVLRDSERDDALITYGAGGFPYWVFVDGDGNVSRRSAGELSIEQLQAYMEEIAPS